VMGGSVARHTRYRRNGKLARLTATKTDAIARVSFV